MKLYLNSMKKVYYIIFLTFIIAGCNNAKKLTIKGDNAYQELEFNQAISYYQKSNEISESKENYIGLTNTYNQLSQYENAYKSLSTAYSKNLLQQNEIGQLPALAYNSGKYQEADSIINELEKKGIESNNFSILKESIRNKKQMIEDSIFFEVAPFLTNKDYNYFSLSTINDSKIVVSDNNKSKGSKAETWNGGYYFDLFSVDNDKKVKELSNKINSEFHEGPASYSKKRKTLFFTRSSIKKGNKADKNAANENHLKIYTSVLDDNSWTTPVEFIHSNNDYSIGHPAVTENGKMLVYISEQEGGYGQTDLYVSFLENETWTEPKNLGNQINTPGKEMFPTLNVINDTLTLFYSSTNKIGLGGLDIYSCQYVNNSWSTPKHLSYPINSSADDFSLTWENESSGYFSSNRATDAHDGIYTFKKIQPRYFLELSVKDETTKEPLSNVSVNINDKTGKESTLTTNEEGKLMIEITNDNRYDIKSFLTNYQAKTTEFKTANLRESDTLQQTILLSNFPVFYVKGIVKDKNTMEPIPYGQINVMNNGASKLLQVDSYGEFIYRLDSNSTYDLATKVPEYFLKREQVSTVGLKKSDTIHVEFILDKLEIAKAIRLENIYYDYNKANIREDAKASLNDLVQTLKDNPTMTIELSSHTDSRGSDSYNKRLSQRRANSVIKYLSENGIDKNRLVAVGYGEEKVLNKCKNGVKCSDEEHQFNRRTEFKILKK